MNIIDLHCDTIDRLLDTNGILKKNNFSIDMEKLKKGNSMAQFFAMYVSLHTVEDPLRHCLNMIDKFYNEIDNNDEISLATNYKSLMSNYNNDKISAFLTIEEGGVLGGSLSNLRNFYRLGVRLITLTWNFENELGYPNALPECKDMGLKKFGIEVVEEMNRLGMIIDVSHLSDGGFYDVAKYSNKPFIASHSNARSLCSHKRNLTDDMIRILGEKGGITGLNFEKGFLNDNGKGNIKDMINHVKHIVKIGGEDVIALGTDFDGISPDGLEIANMGEIDKLISALKKEGFSESFIDKFAYKNALRVIKEVMI